MLRRHHRAPVGQHDTLTALRSIRVRLSRATRALDHLLAALSNPVSGSRRADVVETAAEAFDRQLLYLAAAFDIYGRRYLLLIDSTRNPKNFRFSLDAGGYVTEHLTKEYDADVLADVERLHVYAGVCKELRNHIHDGILPVDQHPGRSYGNSTIVALDIAPCPSCCRAPTQQDDATPLRPPRHLAGRLRGDLRCAVHRR